MIAMSRPGPVPARPLKILSRLHPAMLIAYFLAAVVADLLGGIVLAVLFGGLAFWGLVATGWRVEHLASLFKPWTSIAVLVLLVHVLTTTSAAPLGHPSTLGVIKGVTALIRLAGILMGLALLQCVLEMDALIAGFSWWLRPFGSRFFPARELGLVAAIAMGAAPQALSEGRRMGAVIRLRRGDRGRKSARLSWQRFYDRVVVVVPLLESLARRAETISLTLHARGSLAERPVAEVGIKQLVWLSGWVALLVGLLLLPGRLP